MSVYFPTTGFAVFSITAGPWLKRTVDIDVDGVDSQSQTAALTSIARAQLLAENLPAGKPSTRALFSQAIKHAYSQPAFTLTVRLFPWADVGASSEPLKLDGKSLEAAVYVASVLEAVCHTLSGEMQWNPMLVVSAAVKSGSTELVETQQIVEKYAAVCALARHCKANVRFFYAGNPGWRAAPEDGGQYVTSIAVERLDQLILALIEDYESHDALVGRAPTSIAPAERQIDGSSPGRLAPRRGPIAFAVVLGLLASSALFYSKWGRVQSLEANQPLAALRSTVVAAPSGAPPAASPAGPVAVTAAAPSAKLGLTHAPVVGQGRQVGRASGAVPLALVSAAPPAPPAEEPPSRPGDGASATTPPAKPPAARVSAPQVKDFGSDREQEGEQP